jgi:hypothetical protein
VHHIHRRVYRAIQDKRPQYGGTFTVYDGREDAISHGITNIKSWKDSSIKIGDWVEYPDGNISEVCKVYARTKRKDMGLIISTRLNCFSQSQANVVSTVLPYRCSTTKPKPDTITTSRLEFAEAWLLQGLSIDKACAKHLWQSTGYDGKPLSGKSYRTFAYITITLPWFDELLKSNRLIRDRYMTLVGALGTVGIDEAYVAEKLKEGIESLNVKEKINALNKVIDLLEINAAKKRIPIQASWSVDAPGRIENNSPKQLPETADINNILEDTLHEDVRIRSGISETKRDTPIFPITSHEEQSGRNSETSRIEAVPAQASN